MKIIAALKLTLFLFLLCPSVFAGTVSCSHPELCKLVSTIAAENKIANLKTQVLINMTGDPHEYEPSTAEIKSLLSAPFLITGPVELNPWIKKINFQRSKNSALITISLPFEKTHLEMYPKASAETLSHFWLYPKVYCAFKEKLTAELTKTGEKVSFKGCDAATVEEDLSTQLKKTKAPFILTHDALLPLLVTLDPSHVIVAIKGSGHHEEAGTDAIKKMYKALEAPKAIWIVESGIHVPSNVLNKIRNVDLVIKLDTANSSSSSSFSVLKELTQKLKTEGTTKGTVK